MPNDLGLPASKATEAGRWLDKRKGVVKQKVKSPLFHRSRSNTGEGAGATRAWLRCQNPVAWNLEANVYRAAGIIRTRTLFTSFVVGARCG